MASWSRVSSALPSALWPPRSNWARDRERPRELLDRALGLRVDAARRAPAVERRSAVLERLRLDVGVVRRRDPDLDDARRLLALRRAVERLRPRDEALRDDRAVLPDCERLEARRDPELDEARRPLALLRPRDAPLRDVRPDGLDVRREPELERRELGEDLPPVRAWTRLLWPDRALDRRVDPDSRRDREGPPPPFGRTSLLKLLGEPSFFRSWCRNARFCSSNFWKNSFQEIASSVP